MSTTSFLTPGRICFSVVALGTSIGAYVADWNETHVKNSRWPPHARFHNGQTIDHGPVSGYSHCLLCLAARHCGDGNRGPGPRKA